MTFLRKTICIGLVVMSTYAEALTKQQAEKVLSKTREAGSLTTAQRDEIINRLVTSGPPNLRGDGQGRAEHMVRDYVQKQRAEEEARRAEEEARARAEAARARTVSTTEALSIRQGSPLHKDDKNFNHLVQITDRPEGARTTKFITTQSTDASNIMREGSIHPDKISRIEGILGRLLVRGDRLVITKIRRSQFVATPDNWLLVQD